VGSEKRIFSAIVCLSAVQGHPRSMILVSIESAYVTIGIADVVLPVLSILSIDPALDGNAHTTWNDNTNFFFQNEHSS